MNNEKIIVKTIDALNRKGEKLDYQVSFPFDERYFWAPASIREISIYEYHEGDEIYGFVPFKIYIGKLTSIKEICQSNDKNFSIEPQVFQELSSIDDKLCYYEDMHGKYIVFAKVNDEDIVVENNMEFKEVMVDISNKITNNEYKSKKDGKKLHRIIRIYKPSHK